MAIPPDRPPTWDDFVDLVLPWVGTSRLDQQLAMATPTLPPSERVHWVQRFNRVDSAHRGRFVETLDWTEDEIDGVWYDDMKAIALACISTSTLDEPPGENQ